MAREWVELVALLRWSCGGQASGERRRKEDSPPRPAPREARGGRRALMRGDQKAKKDTPHPPVFAYVGETKDLRANGAYVGE